MWKWIIPFALTVVVSSGSARADDGKALFQQKCSACHTVGEGVRVGPDLRGVTEKRDEAWLKRWIIEPDVMIAQKDPIAIELLQQFNQIPMPNLGVSEAEAASLLAYMASASQATGAAAAGQVTGETVPVKLGATQLIAMVLFVVLALVITSVFWFVARSTRDAVPTIDMKSAYRLRKVFFFSASVVLLGLLAMTLMRLPYPDSLQTPDRLVYVTARQFSFTYSAEPITSEEDVARVAQLASLEIEAGSLVEFRVTSLDATHAFAIYQPDASVLAQTQAMPGYVNRLRVRFPEAGHFNVLCLEYCGVAHHAMRSAFVVR